MKQTVGRVISVLCYVLAIVIGIYQLLTYEASHEHFIGWLFIVYGGFSLLFFIFDRRREAQ